MLYYAHVYFISFTSSKRVIRRHLTQNSELLSVHVIDFLEKKITYKQKVIVLLHILSKL